MTLLRIALLAIGIGLPGGLALATGPVRVVLALDQPADVTERISHSLSLHVQGDEDGFWIDVTDPKPARGCHSNLAHWAPHGPDPGDIVPWHITTGHFPNKSEICCRHIDRGCARKARRHLIVRSGGAGQR